MSKHSRSTANPRSENKRSRIQSWLMQEGWQLAELHAPEAEWVISATNAAGHVLVVAQEKKALNRLAVQGSVTIDPRHRAMINALTLTQRQTLLTELRFGLLSMELDFDGVVEPLETIQVSQRVYDDGLTEDRFQQRASQVKRGVIFTIWTIAKTLEQPFEDASSFTN